MCSECHSPDQKSTVKAFVVVGLGCVKFDLVCCRSIPTANDNVDAENLANDLRIVAPPKLMGRAFQISTVCHHGGEAIAELRWDGLG